MKNKFLLIWPYLFIFILWAVFSSPFLLKAKIPFTGDYQVTFFPPWSQYAEFTMPVKNNAMPDVIDQLYPWKHLVINEWKTGQIPLWNPYNFAGTPLLANYQSAVFSPLNLLFFIFPFRISWALLVLFQPLLAGMGMYVFTRKVRISQVGSVLSSIAFMFCGFLVTWMGYGTLGYAVSALPFVLLGLEGYKQSRSFFYLLLVSFSLLFSFVSGHFQMSLYVVLAGVLYFLFRFIPEKNLKIFLIPGSSLLIGILLAAPQIFPSIAFYSQSLRSTIFARPEVIPWQYLFTLVAPDFFGNPVTRNDWFGHYAEWSSYIGVFPLLFALFSVKTFWKNTYSTFFTFLGVLALLLATPTILGDLILYAHVPVLATSAAGRIIVLLSFSLAILAGLGYDSWSKSQRKYILGITAIVLLLIGWGIILGKIGLSAEHASIAKQNFILPSLFLLSVVLFSLGGMWKNKKVFLGISMVLLLVTAFDMYRFASKWQSFTSQNFIFPDVGVTKFFQTIPNQRTLGNYGGQVSIYYELPSVEGYDALYPENFGEFVSFVANGKIQPASRSAVDFPRSGRYTKEALDLLGVQYIFHKISDTGKSWTFPVEKYPGSLQAVYKDNAYIVYKNLTALPRVFIAGQYIVENTKQEVLGKLFSSIDRRKTLVLEQDPHIAQATNLIASAKMISNSYNKTTITTQSNTKALLFLSDTYFPGWQVYIDGKETNIFRADYTFRAISIPSGKHVVEFSYLPLSFIYGLIGASIGLVGLVFFYYLSKRVS